MKNRLLQFPISPIAAERLMLDTKNPLLSRADLWPTSQELWKDVCVMKRRVSESRDANAVFELVAAFQKWVKRAWEGGVDSSHIDYVFDDMCALIAPLADHDPVALARYIVLLSHAKYAGMATARRITKKDINILTATAERDAAQQGPHAVLEVEHNISAISMAVERVIEIPAWLARHR